MRLVTNGVSARRRPAWVPSSMAVPGQMGQDLAVQPDFVVSAAARREVIGNQRRDPLQFLIDGRGIRGGQRHDIALDVATGPQGREQALVDAGDRRLEVVLEHAVKLDALAELAPVYAVRDNGAGFDGAKPSAGSGLQNIRDRVDALEGTLEIQTGPTGSCIRGSIPT